MIFNNTLESNTIVSNLNVQNIQALQQFADFAPIITLIVVFSMIVTLLRYPLFWDKIKYVFQKLGLEKQLIFFCEGLVWSTIIGILYVLVSIVPQQAYSSQAIITGLKYAIMGVFGLIIITLFGHLMSMVTRKAITKLLLDLWQEIVEKLNNGGKN